MTFEEAFIEAVRRGVKARMRKQSWNDGVWLENDGHPLSAQLLWSGGDRRGMYSPTLADVRATNWEVIE